MNETFYKILPNGLKIVHRMTDSPVAYIGLMVGTGTRDEQVKLSGLAHYVEHCVFKGCKQYGREPLDHRLTTAKDIINKIEGIGGEINAFTTKEETTFYAAVPREHYASTIRLIGNMVLHPTFPKKETDIELGVILDEIESYNDSPSELIYDDFENLLFSGHGLGNPILGTKKSLRTIASSPKYANQWVEEQFMPDRMVFFTQGKLKFESVCREIEKLFDGIEAHHHIQREKPEIQRGKEVAYKKHTHQTHIMLGGEAYPLGHEKQLGLYLLNNILGGGSLNSRLNMSLRETKGLVYTIEAQYTPLSDSGYWNIYMATEPQHQEQCIELVYKELKKLRTERMSSLQLERAIKQLHGQMAISAENRENSALSMAKQMLYHSSAPTWEEIFPKIANTTVELIQEIANEVYSEAKINTLLYI